MRAPTLVDAVAAARALRAVPEADRPALLRRLIREARQACRHVRSSGRAYPRFGDGSLIAAALGHPVAREPGLDDGDYCRCLAAVLLTLAEGRLSPFSRDPERLCNVERMSGIDGGGDGENADICEDGRPRLVPDLG